MLEFDQLLSYLQIGFGRVNIMGLSFGFLLLNCCDSFKKNHAATTAPSELNMLSEYTKVASKRKYFLS